MSAEISISEEIIREAHPDNDVSPDTARDDFRRYVEHLEGNGELNGYSVLLKKGDWEEISRRLREDSEMLKENDRKLGDSFLGLSMAVWGTKEK
jgi:hypothetical protein